MTKDAQLLARAHQRHCGAAMCAVWRSCIFLQFFRPAVLIIQKSRALRDNALKFFELHFLFAAVLSSLACFQTTSSDTIPYLVTFLVYF